MKRTIVRTGVAGMVVAATLLGGIGLMAGTASAATPYDITINANPDAGGDNSLTGRSFTAYKLADYVDGTYVSVGDKSLDGVAVDTPDSLKAAINPVLAKTAGVDDVTKLPGWDKSGKDPISWMGGFRQDKGTDKAHNDNQAQGNFDYGWNESGWQNIGLNSPDKAYVGSVREFADNLVKDPTALAAIKAQPHSETVKATAGASVIIPLTAEQGSGIYLILDDAPAATWTGTNTKGQRATWNVGSTQPMIVPTKADDKDLATMPGYTPSDPNKLGTVGKLGEITIKNVDDVEVLPECPSNIPPNTPPSKYPPECQPKYRDTSTNPGKDSADNGSDIGDTVPYIVHYRTPDLSAYKAAYDNGEGWIYNYRIQDQTTAGLKIGDEAPTVTVPGIDGKTITINPTKVDQIPAYAQKGTGTKDGQPNEPDAWYYIASDGEDSSHLVVGLGRWIVKNYGNIKANDKSKTMYGHQFEIKYSATITPKILEHSNMAHNENWLEYSNTPDDVQSGDVAHTPHVIVKQWTYDVDLHKRASTSNHGLKGAEFKVTVKDNANTADGKANGSTLKWVKTGKDGDYRLARASDTDAVDTVVTGDDGLLRLRGLDLGSYTLTETKAPRNYRLLDKSEDVTVSAKFEDDGSDFVTPNAQTEAKLTISKNNSIIPLVKPMFNFATTQDKAPKGLTITATEATWGGKDESGAYYADDKTNWVPADLTLWNQPINVMLAKTGGVIGFTAIMLAGLALIGVGVTALGRRRSLD